MVIGGDIILPFHLLSLGLERLREKKRRVVDGQEKVMVGRDGRLSGPKEKEERI